MVCEDIPNKEDPNRNCITVAVNCVSYPGDVAIPTGSLELLKLIINIQAQGLRDFILKTFT